MKFQHKKIATALAQALGGTALVAATLPADAADIVRYVTGSNLPATETEGALPVQVITRDEIERTGVITTQDLMQLISANNSNGSVTSNIATGVSTFSAQMASLRGLGSQRTLVLINGQRPPNFAGTTQGVSGVDLSAIPFSAIERVEVLKDGASAIYGSDAEAGVMNFILRQDYTGFEATGYYGTPSRSGDGDSWNAMGTAGWGDLTKDRYNVFISAYYTKQEQVWNKDRDFAKTGYKPDIGLFAISGNTFPAYVSTGRIGSLTYPNCTGTYNGLIDPENLGERCWFDTNPAAQAIPELKQYGAYASGRFQLTPDWQVYLNGMYTKAENNIHIQPTPISDQFPVSPGSPADLLGYDGSITIKPTNPNYPTQQAIAAGVNGQPLNVRYRCVDCGDRMTQDTTESWGVVGGIKGNWKNWDWDLTGVYNKQETKENTVLGFVLQSVALPLLNNSNGFNPFGPSTAEFQQAFAAAQYQGNVYTAQSTNYGVNFKGSGEIGKLPAGPMALALGVQAWKQEFDQQSAPVLSTGDLTGYGGPIPGVTESRNLWAVYGELGVPIVKSLEGTVAVRYDHYSDFGSTTNPKFSLRWQPYKEVLLRGSYGTGFMAPDLYQLYAPDFQGVTQPGLSDPVRCPVTEDSNDCFTQFGVQFGGNRNLVPEKSFQVNAGIVLSPVPTLNVSIDWFKINISNYLGNGTFPAVVLADQTTYANLITRAPVDPAYPDLPGQITLIEQRYVNLGGVHETGWDIGVNYTFPQAWFGQLSFALNGEYITKFDINNPPWTGYVANQFGAPLPGVIPRYKQYASLTWNYGPWSATLSNSYQSSYIDMFDVTGGLDPSLSRRVSSMSLWDIQGSYTGFKNWKLTAGVKNMFDTNPPLTDQGATFQNGYDPSYYDARAAFIYGSVTYTFK